MFCATVGCIDSGRDPCLLALGLLEATNGTSARLQLDNQTASDGGQGRVG